MKRIGIAAGKIAQGNTLGYNMAVVVISFLISAFVFILVGATVIFALTVLTYIGREFNIFELTSENRLAILKICTISLTIIIGAFNVLAIIKNVRFGRRKR